MGRRDSFRAAGHFLILLPPAVLMIAAWSEHPLLAFAIIFGVLPLLRAVFGDAPERCPEWSEPISIVLHALPVPAGLAFLAAMASTAWSLAQRSWNSEELLGLGLSLWATCLLASCVAHELLHRRDPLCRGLGQFMSGVMGYPLLEQDHRAHHRHQGKVASAECPAVRESLWGFSARRLRLVLRMTWENDLAASLGNGHGLDRGLAASVGGWLAAMIAFWSAGGLRGLSLYLTVSVGVAWALQAMTYVQHWGLASDDPSPEAPCIPTSWEDRCQLQSWLTLGISFHQAHHDQSHVPYYRLQVTPISPRPPAGYVVLLIVACVPSLWRAWMLPVLRQWRRCPQDMPSAGRRLICIARPPH